MAMISSIAVECYSGYTYAQEPRAFVFESQRRRVTAVQRRWREPAGPCFQVLADDARSYTLAYDQATDRWNLRLPTHAVLPEQDAVPC